MHIYTVTIPMSSSSSSRATGSDHRLTGTLAGVAALRFVVGVTTAAGGAERPANINLPRLLQLQLLPYTSPGLS